jgi:FkbM family methyltransferase
MGFVNRFRSITNQQDDTQPKLSYSQSGEDLVIDYAFKAHLGVDNPTYLDIGAHHPKTINNTYLFYERGCRGVLVEPDPELAANIRRVRPQDTVLNVGITESEGEADFYLITPSTLNTFSLKEFEQYKIFHHAKLRDTVTVKTLPINAVLKKHFSKGLDLLSIDVEGLDYQIVSSIDLKKYRPKVVCLESVEYTGGDTYVKSKKLASYLYKNGYFLYADTFINSIFVDETAWAKSNQPKLKNFIGR